MSPFESMSSRKLLLLLVFRRGLGRLIVARPLLPVPVPVPIPVPVPVEAEVSTVFRPSTPLLLLPMSLLPPVSRSSLGSTRILSFRSCSSFNCIVGESVYHVYIVYSVYRVYSVYSMYGVYGVYSVYSVYSVYRVYRVCSVYSVYSVYSVCILYIACIVVC